MPGLLRPEDIIQRRRCSIRQSAPASDLPRTIDDAYDFATATIKLLGTRVAGWKLGATTAGTRRAFATDEIYFGALLDEEIWDAGGTSTLPSPPVFRGEAEIALRLGVDVCSDASGADVNSQASALFDAWAPALEAPYSCISNVGELGLRALLMDRCSAGALYLGVSRQGIDERDMNRPLQIFVDGVCMAEGTASTSLLMSPVDAATGFLQVALSRGVNMFRGQWISTGGITSCVDLPYDKRIKLAFGGQTELSFKTSGPAE
jgi:2-keto-4-pentenoate hydratase